MLFKNYQIWRPQNARKLLRSSYFLRPRDQTVTTMLLYVSKDKCFISEKVPRVRMQLSHCNRYSYYRQLQQLCFLYWYSIARESDEILFYLWNVHAFKGSSTLNDTVTVPITWRTAPLVFLTGTAMGRMGRISILPVGVTFVIVTVTKSLGVDGPQNVNGYVRVNFLTEWNHSMHQLGYGSGHYALRRNDWRSVWISLY